MSRLILLTVLFAAITFSSCAQKQVSKDFQSSFAAKDRVIKTNDEWKKLMTPGQYSVMREQGTERPFTGKYADNHEDGIYYCAACNLPLFDSKTKFESGTGWPSFYLPINKMNVAVEKDNSSGMTRDEVHCARCGGHLGHVFDDGPKPTGLRYCMNSISLSFKPR